MCRKQKTSHMLIDFAEALQTDVYELGRSSSLPLSSSVGFYLLLRIPLLLRLPLLLRFTPDNLRGGAVLCRQLVPRASPCLFQFRIHHIWFSSTIVEDWWRVCSPSSAFLLSVV